MITERNFESLNIPLEWNLEEQGRGNKDRIQSQVMRDRDIVISTNISNILRE